MSGLSYHDKKEIPPWCCIFENGRLESPSANWLWIPRDAYRSLDVFWDGIRFRGYYYVWDYGIRYHYAGPALPSFADWTKEHYLPDIDLEIKIIKLAATQMEFEELEKKVKRPRMEIAAIMSEHGYNGSACAIHRNIKTELMRESAVFDLETQTLRDPSE